METICGLPATLHPYSQSLLSSFLKGETSASTFSTRFSLPNSDYLEFIPCIIAFMEGVAL